MFLRDSGFLRASYPIRGNQHKCLRFECWAKFRLRNYSAPEQSRDRFCFTMVSREDKRWQNLEGAYRISFDPRPLLSELEIKMNASTWHEPWEGLYHQGDVGTASYAAVPHLVTIYRKRGRIDWNTYAIVTVIELARDDGKNPKVPNWLENDYFQAIRDLAAIGAVESQKRRTSKRFEQYSVFLRFLRVLEPMQSSW